jgi:4-carboxymuconolactone decarboxylase
MSNRPLTPRILPLSPNEQDEQTRELLSKVGDGGTATNIFTTLVRHPGLFRKWSPFGGKLLAGKLPIRDRELLILRTGWLCQSEYEWGQHSLIAKAHGFSDGELKLITQWPSGDGWNECDAILLEAADQLHNDGCISDTTWAALAERYDDRQLIEVPMLVGQYHLVAFVLNSLGVQREPGVPGFDL